MAIKRRAQKPHVWGFKIVPDIRTINTKGGESQEFDFKVRMMKGNSTDRSFYTNKRLQEFIKKHKSLRNFTKEEKQLGHKELGFINYRWDGEVHKNRPVLEGRIYPFGTLEWRDEVEFEKNKRGGSTTFEEIKKKGLITSEEIKKKGFGLDLEGKVKRDLRKYVRDYFGPNVTAYLKPGMGVTTIERKAQLGKSERGGEIKGGLISLDDSIHNVNQAKALWHRKFKPVNPKLVNPQTALDKSVRRQRERVTKIAAQRIGMLPLRTFGHETGEIMGSGFFKTVNPVLYNGAIGPLGRDTRRVAKFAGNPQAKGFYRKYALPLLTGNSAAPPWISRMMYAPELRHDARRPENLRVQGKFVRAYGGKAGNRAYNEWLDMQKSRRDENMLRQALGGKYVTRTARGIRLVNGKPMVVEMQRKLNVRSLQEMKSKDPKAYAEAVRDPVVRKQLAEITHGLRNLHNSRPDLYVDVGERHIYIDPRTRQVHIPDAQLARWWGPMKLRYKSRDDKIVELEELLR